MIAATDRPARAYSDRMTNARRILVTLLLLSAAAVALAACATFSRGPVGNAAVPQPAKPVEFNRYAGRWYEIGRYDNGFERDCEAVTADYRLLEGGEIEVINSCRKGGLDGPVKTATGRARVVDYWVLDHADDYAWSIVGEPSGRYLWLLSRAADPPADVRDTIQSRVRELGYATSLIRPTRH